MERLGAPLSELGPLGWDNVYNLARHIAADSGSYTYRGRHPKEAAYAEGLHIAAMVADLYDLVADFAVMYARAHSGGRSIKKIPKYPRPWAKSDDSQRIGKGAIPVSDFDEWYYGGD